MSATVYFLVIAWLPVAWLGGTLLVERRAKPTRSSGWRGPGDDGRTFR